MSDQEVIKQFYTVFQHRDYQAMQALYADKATFSDAVFQNLNAAEVKAMWEMLISRGKDMTIVFTKVASKGNLTTAHWEATYTLSSTGNKVVNSIDAEFLIADGKIIKHTDRFHFYRWARQAFGFKGLLLGWTSFFKNKVRDQARQNLKLFMDHKG